MISGTMVASLKGNDLRDHGIILKVTFKSQPYSVGHMTSLESAWEESTQGYEYEREQLKL